MKFPLYFDMRFDLASLLRLLLLVPNQLLHRRRWRRCCSIQDLMAMCQLRGCGCFHATASSLHAVERSTTGKVLLLLLLLLRHRYPGRPTARAKMLRVGSCSLPVVVGVCVEHHLLQRSGGPCSGHLNVERLCTGAQLLVAG